MLELIASAALSLTAAASQAAPQPQRAAWTIAFYAGGDNSSEESVISDLAQVAEQLRAIPSVQLIALVDRSPRYTNEVGAFGED
ncbi:MAG: hypothetical protein EPO68_11235, partial [Planctomycetota bacterium]